MADSLTKTICQKTPDKTAEYFAAVWALHAISKVERFAVRADSAFFILFFLQPHILIVFLLVAPFDSWSAAAMTERSGWRGRNRCTPFRNRWSSGKSRLVWLFWDFQFLSV